MLAIDFEIEKEGMTVPYPQLFSDIGRNHGFVDLRGRPDLAIEIPEGSQSPALKAILVELSEPDISSTAARPDSCEYSTEYSTTRLPATETAVRFAPRGQDRHGYRGYGLPISEMISEGNIGLVQAVNRFEPEKGFRLATYESRH